MARHPGRHSGPGRHHLRPVELRELAIDDVPHINWPIQVQGAAYATNQQDTDQEAAANIAVLCCFERGTRIENTDFGITDPTFQQIPVDTGDIERQAAIYEPRAQLTIQVADDGTGGQRVTVAVRIATVQEAI